MKVYLEPLTNEAFEPFGTIVSHDWKERRWMVETGYEGGRGMPLFWLAGVKQPASFPLSIKELERHPHSSQTFIPRGNFPHVVVVALGTEAGPDMQTLRAFMADGTQGVTYRRNCWHLGLTPLDGHSEFVVSMIETDDHDQTVIARLAEECVINL